MKEKYFKNKKNNKNYSFDELINSGPLFRDDFIWKEGLKEWKRAEEIEELKEYVSDRPPQKKSVVILKTILESLLPSIIILISFSIIIGTTGGIVEKIKYEKFIKEVQPNIERYFKEKQERIEKENQEESERRGNIHVKLLNLELEWKSEDSRLKLLQDEAYNHYISSMNYNDKNVYISLAQRYQNQRQNLLDQYKRDTDYWKSQLTSKKNNSNVLETVSYDVPTGTLAIIKDNKLFTRWKVYQGVGNHEQLSYEHTYRFLFRPYRTFYEVVNLSVEEINNSRTLVWNFVLSAFISNLMFFPIILLIVTVYKRQSQLKLKK